MFEALTRKDNWVRYLKSLKFALYCITHPIDGFWDLTHEHRGTYAAANTILITAIVVRIMKLRYTSFIFLRVYWEDLNIFLYIASILFPLALFVVGNWASTTLFDGKGKLGQIYMGTCYAIAIYPIVQLPLMIFSNFVTVDEAGFYSVVSIASLVYAALMIISAMGQIHEFGPGKNILFIFVSLFAMLVIVFILLLFSSMILQGVSYFVSLGREFLFRI